MRVSSTRQGAWLTRGVRIASSSDTVCPAARSARPCGGRLVLVGPGLIVCRRVTKRADHRVIALIEHPQRIGGLLL